MKKVFLVLALIVGLAMPGQSFSGASDIMKPSLGKAVIGGALLYGTPQGREIMSKGAKAAGNGLEAAKDTLQKKNRSENDSILLSRRRGDPDEGNGGGKG